MREAEAISHGAITIVNAMATGRGAAIGIQLWTKAKVEITNDAGCISGRILSDTRENDALLRLTVNRVLRRYGLHRKLGAYVETTSNIPIAVGLKSSSAASNAVALATVAALRKRVNYLEVLRLAVKSSFDAGVTLTGAFDDASACLLGGLVVTDNIKNEILQHSRHISGSDSLRVVIYVPSGKKYSGSVNRFGFRKIKDLVNLAHAEAIKGNYSFSMTLNGIAYCKAFGYDTSPVTDALREGALAASLSGKGPAIAAIVRNDNVKHLISAWSSYPGKIIQTGLNYEKAKAKIIS